MKYFSFLMCGQVCLGDDGGVRPERQHGGVRRHGQHAHHLRPQQQGRPGEVLILDFFSPLLPILTSMYIVISITFECFAAWFHINVTIVRC